MKISFKRTDLASDKACDKFKHIYSENNIKVLGNNIYRLIEFNFINNSLKEVIKKELNYFLNKIRIKKSVLIVGLGNDNYTADSVGPKTLKTIQVNSYLDDDNISGIKVSALEPGVLGQTGIDTKRIVKGIVNEIKPDFLIIIDSFVSSNVEKIEKTVQISNKGIIPGSGIMGLNSKIDKRTMKVPVIVIGVPCALEITIKNNNYILASNNIDKYVLDISKVIGNAINEVLYFS